MASRAGARPPGRAQENLEEQSKGFVAGALGMEMEICQMFPWITWTPGRALPRHPPHGVRITNDLVIQWPVSTLVLLDNQQSQHC